jgi:alkyl hydroperoxide reductase subunit AhpC
VVVISDDDLEAARLTQADFPHLVVVSDADQNIAKALDVIHKGAGRDGGDANAPTTFLVNGLGQVKWYFRPDRFIGRLPVDDLLKSIEGVQ